MQRAYEKIAMNVKKREEDREQRKSMEAEGALNGSLSEVGSDLEKDQSEHGRGGGHPVATSPVSPLDTPSASRDEVDMRAGSIRRVDTSESERTDTSMATKIVPYAMKVSCTDKWPNKLLCTSDRLPVQLP